MSNKLNSSVADELIPGNGGHSADAVKHVVILLDKSGSMVTRMDQVISGFNEFLSTQKGLHGTAYLTLIAFSTDYKVIYEREEISKVQPLTSVDYIPTGLTALLDAVHSVVSANYTEDNVIVCIVTDGEENSSKEHTKEEVKSLVSERTSKGWTFFYLGANVDNFEAEASAIGVSGSVSYVDDTGLQRNFSSVSGFAGAQSLTSAFAAVSDIVTLGRTSVSYTTDQSSNGGSK